MRPKGGIMKTLSTFILILTLSQFAWSHPTTGDLESLGLPEVHGNRSVLYFGQVLNGEDALHKLEALVKSGTIESCEHSYRYSVPSEMVSELHFSTDDRVVVVQLLYSLENKWELSSVGFERNTSGNTPFSPLDILKSLFLGTAVVTACFAGNLSWKRVKSLRPEALDGVDSTPELADAQKAAVLLMSLPPELSARLFSALTPEEVQALTLEITRLPRISPWDRQSVIDETFGGISTTVSQLELLAKENPKLLAETLRRAFLRSEPSEAST